MRVVDIEDFRANMEDLIECLEPGESFLLSVEGIPKVQVIALADAERERLHDETQTEAKTHLSGPVDEAENGDSFIIT